MFYEAGDGQRDTRRRPLFLETMPFARAGDLRGFRAPDDDEAAAAAPPPRAARARSLGDSEAGPSSGEAASFVAGDDVVAPRNDDLPAPYEARWRALPLSLHADHEELLPNSVLMHQAVVDARFGHLATNAEYERFVDYYLNALRDSDAHLGQVLDAVDALEGSGDGRGVAVFFCSDHGEMLGAHQCRQKGNVLYRENVSTPLCAKVPGGVFKGAVQGGTSAKTSKANFKGAPGSLGRFPARFVRCFDER